MGHRLKKLGNSYKPDAPIVKENERRRITGSLNIDFSTFKKTPEEKLRLKLAKAGQPLPPPPPPKKKTRGGWAWRMRRRLRKEGLEYAEIEKRISQFATTRIALKKSSAQNSPSE